MAAGDASSQDFVRRESTRVWRALVVILLFTNVAFAGLLLRKYEGSSPSSLYAETLPIAPAPAGHPLLVQLANQIQGMGGDGTTTAKNLHGWISCSIGTAQAPNTASVADVLTNMAAYCGWRDNLFKEAAAQLGFEHRRIGFLNVPTVISHATTEILVNDRWLFFDCSFGRYFASPDQPDLPLSIDEVRSLWPNVLVAHVTNGMNQGDWLYDSAFHYALEPASELAPDVISDFEQLYILSDLVIFHPAEVYHERITIPLWLEDWHSIGAVDQSQQDLAPNYRVAAEGLNDPLYSPFLPLFGRYGNSGPIIDKVFEFQTQETVPVELRLHFVGDAVPPVAADVQHTALRRHQADRVAIIDSHDSTITIRFVAHPPSSRLVMRNLGHTALLDAIEWQTTHETK